MRGFTLIELLVATFILAVLGGMAYRGLSAVQDGERRLAAVSGRWQDVARAVERIGRDVRQAIDRPGRDAEGRPLPVFQGRRDAGDAADGVQLALGRTGGDGLDTRRVGYRRRDGALELLVWPAPEASGAAVRSYRLLEGVASLEFAYLDEAGRWQDSWPPPAANARPRAVRLRLGLEEGASVERLFDLP